MLLGTSAATLLANMLSGPAGKGVSRAGEEQNQKKTRLFMLPHLLNNFEIQRYYQNEPRFNGVY